MKAIEIINESLELSSAFPLRWKEYPDAKVAYALVNNDPDDVVSYLFREFYDEDGLPTSNMIDFAFKRNESVEMTGGGSEREIFATALKAINEYLSKYDRPEYFSFSGFSPNRDRTDFYSRLAARYASQYGYKRIVANAMAVEEGLLSLTALQLIRDNELAPSIILADEQKIKKRQAKIRGG